MIQQKRVDVAVLGGGPGGYPAAIRLAQAGRTVALIEEKDVGGTCLNRGCIPTKALLSSVAVLREINRADTFGIHVEGVCADWKSMVSKKDEVVAKLLSGLQGLIRSNDIELIKGRGKLISPHEVEVSGENAMTIQADNIIVATGSESKDISSLTVDGEYIHSSTTLLNLEELPESIAIVGAGAIGCEFATIFSTLGVQVYVIEALSRILPLECETVSWAVAQGFQQDNIEIFCGEMVLEAEMGKKGVDLRLSGGKTIHAGIVLSSVGRTLNTSGIGLEEVGVHLENGVVITDECMQTNIDSIWAVGDITARAMYAHAATHQGIVAAENILGNRIYMHYDAMPRAIFTKPEVGCVGMSLHEAKESGFQAKLGSFPFQALGRAQASFRTEGFVQIVIEEDTGRILGAQIVGNHAGDLVSELGVAITNELTVECLTESIHIHPTFAEAAMEAAYIVQDQSLHFPKPMLSSVQRT